VTTRGSETDGRADKGGMTHKRKWNEISDNRTTAGLKLISKLCKKAKQVGLELGLAWGLWVTGCTQSLEANASQSEVTLAQRSISGLYYTILHFCKTLWAYLK